MTAVFSFSYRNRRTVLKEATGPVHLSILSHLVAFYQGLELGFVYGALTSSSAIRLAALGLVLRIRDYNLAPSALKAAVSKISEASLTKTSHLVIRKMVHM